MIHLSLENKKAKHLKVLLIFLAVSSLIFLLLHGPIPQSVSYHSFADHNTFYGINNFYNVVSNFPFLMVGAVGIFLFWNTIFHWSLQDYVFLSVYSLPDWALLIIIMIRHHPPWFGTDFLWPSLLCLFFAFILFRNFSFQNNDSILVVLLLIGIFSIVYWHVGELKGNGDLRWYALVQFYPVVAIIIILLWNGNDRQMLGVILWYIAAKVFEATDEAFLSLTEVVSGHTIKHLMAACAAMHLLVLFYFENKAMKKNF